MRDDPPYALKLLLSVTPPLFYQAAGFSDADQSKYEYRGGERKMSIVIGLSRGGALCVCSHHKDMNKNRAYVFTKVSKYISQWKNGDLARQGKRRR